MAFIETDALVKVRDIEGKEYLIYPITKAENVQGLDTFIGNILDTSGSEIAQGVGVKFDPTKDKLVVYNPYSNQWVETDITTGKIILPSTITVNTTSLGGQAVTCTIGEESYTTTFVVTEGTNGVAVFTVYSDGVATITCGEFSVEVTVAKNGGQSISTKLEEFNGIYLIKNGSFDCNDLGLTLNNDGNRTTITKGTDTCVKCGGSLIFMNCRSLITTIFTSGLYTSIGFRTYDISTCSFYHSGWDTMYTVDIANKKLIQGSGSKLTTSSLTETVLPIGLWDSNGANNSNLKNCRDIYLSIGTSALIIKDFWIE